MYSRFSHHLRHSRQSGRAPRLSVNGLAVLMTSAVLMLSGCTAVSEQPLGPAVASEYACGQLKIRVAAIPERDLLGLDYRDKRLLLKPLETGSGAVFQAPGDRSTQFRPFDGRAELMIRGESYPECLPPGALERPFIARGSDPVWRARVADGELIISQPYEDQAPVRLTSRLATADRHGREFVGQGDGLLAILTVATQLCQDPVTGAQFPSQARLTLNGDSYQGCGGDPLRLIRGAEWAVTELSAQGIIDRSKVTLRFLDDHRVAGRASCNRFTGRFQLLDEGGIEFSELATARMACAASLMEQEAQFIGALARASTIRIGRQGQLVLLAAGDPLLIAVQSDQDTP